MINLTAQPLTQKSFSPFGEVIELEHAHQIPINQGHTIRFHDLINIDATDRGGRAIISVFRTDPLSLPHRVKLMERHPFGSQAFYPMDQDPFLVLVADSGDKVTASNLHLFVTNGRQGINLHKNTWHHFQIGLNRQRDFFVVDRGGDGTNLEEVVIEEAVQIPENIIHNL
ncbi:MAG: ureidoglycolate lyase [bacterium]